MSRELIHPWDSRIQGLMRHRTQEKAWKARENVESAKSLYDQGLISGETYGEIVTSARDLIYAKNAACKEADAPKWEYVPRDGVDLHDMIGMIGQGFHTAFRKGTDDDAARFIHAAIDELEPDEWHAILRYVAEPLFEAIKAEGLVE